MRGLEPTEAPVRVRVLSDELGEAEKRMLRLLLEATLASETSRAVLSGAEVLGAGGPPFSRESLGKVVAVMVELERPSGGYSYLVLFEGLNVEDTRLEVTLAGLNEALRVGLREALRQGTL